MNYNKLQESIDERLLDFCLIWDVPVEQMKSAWNYRYNNLLRVCPDSDLHKSKLMVKAYQGLRDYYTKKDKIQRYLR